MIRCDTFCPKQLIMYGPTGLIYGKELAFCSHRKMNHSFSAVPGLGLLIAVGQ